MYDLTQALNVSDVGSNAEIDLENLSLFYGPDAILGMFYRGWRACCGVVCLWVNPCTSVIILFGI